MKQRHVILREFGQHRSRGSAALPMTNRIDAAALPVVVEDINLRDVPSLREDASLTVAPVVPMRLIRPLEELEVDEAAAGDVAWGVKAVGAHTSPCTGQGVVVAVLDTGIDRNHPAFAEVDVEEADFTGEGNGDSNGHGTHCAGTIFGGKVGTIRIGVAPRVKKALIGKVLGGQGGGSTEQIIQGIQWAVEKGANVISMSLGMDFPGYQKYLMERMKPEPATSLALEGYRANILLFERLASMIRAMQQLSTQPTIIIAAAGNESERPDYEIAVAPPAVAEGFVSVAALGESGQGLNVAAFSNTAACLAAPGVRIVSARAGGGLVALSGTSMAAPHVAGVAALWAERIQQQGGLFNAQILLGRMTGAATTTGLVPGHDPVDIGAGLVQAPQ